MTPRQGFGRRTVLLAVLAVVVTAALLGGETVASFGDTDSATVSVSGEPPETTTRSPVPVPAPPGGPIEGSATPKPTTTPPVTPVLPPERTPTPPSNRTSAPSSTPTTPESTVSVTPSRG